MSDHYMNGGSIKPSDSPPVAEPRDSQLRGRVEQLAMLAERMGHMISRIEGAADRIGGPTPEPSREGGRAELGDIPGAPLIVQLDMIAEVLGRNFNRAATAADKLDELV